MERLKVIFHRGAQIQMITTGMSASVEEKQALIQRVADSQDGEITEEIHDPAHVHEGETEQEG